MEPVRIVDLDATPTAVVRATTTWDAFPDLWPSLLDEVWASSAGAAWRPGAT